ncbi:MAG: response regulator transcription factor [Chloroflexales bacterium]|nr:response regulator transcription factor [Chloroflexales bacterium]
MKNSVLSCSGRPSNQLRVVIADDMELMRIGLRHALEAEPDLSVVGVAADGREALDMCGRLRPDLALLDERMPEMDGLEATRALKQRHPAIRVIILSPQGDLRCRREALKAGADGWLLKNVTRGKLAAALRQVQRGKPLFSGHKDADLLHQIYGLAPEQSGPAREQLTPRELDVLRLLAQGLTNLQIAHTLLLSRGTVKAYVEQIIAKLRVPSRTLAAVRALELGLLQMTAE